MRTTIRLDDDLLTAAKQYALETERTLTRLIEDALREVLARRAARPARRPIQLPSGGSGGLQAGIDLDDNQALRALMDGDGCS